MFKKALKNERGFTLVELLAVIVILGIIAAIAIPAIGNIIQNSKEDAVKADAITVLEGAKLMYASENVENLDTSGDGSIKWTEGLGDYVQLTNTSDIDADSGEGLDIDTIYVSFDENGIPSITANGLAGDETISFVNAKIEDINNAGNDELTITGS